MLFEDSDRNFLNAKIEDIKKTFANEMKPLLEISQYFKEVKENFEKSKDEDSLAKDRETLAIISKRLEEVKEKLETGQLKAKESEMVGIEHRVLRENYEHLVKKLFQKSIKKS